MKRTSIRRPGALAAALLLAVCASATESRWQETDKILGQAGKPQPGDVQKYSWPRRDLHVTIAKIPVQPALALGSWAAFHSSGSETMAMGDLVLLESEVNPVIRQLQAGGLKTALAKVATKP